MSTARPRRVEVVVLGRGLLAALLAADLIAAGRHVALLVEAPGWEVGSRLAWSGWHSGPRAALAREGAGRLAALDNAGSPGIIPGGTVDGQPLWRLELDRLLPALVAPIEADERSSLALGTRVRGLSVIEGELLGAIAEEARYDARIVVNAGEDARYAAYARMMREPRELDLSLVTPTQPPQPLVEPDGRVGFPGAVPFLRDVGPLEIGPSAIRGGWRAEGIAGWPLLALGAATRLARKILDEAD